MNFDNSILLGFSGENYMIKKDYIKILKGMKKSLLEDCAYQGADIPKKWIKEQGLYYKGYNQAITDILNKLIN